MLMLMLMLVLLALVQGMQTKMLAQCGAMESLINGLCDAVHSGDDVTRELMAGLLLLQIELSKLTESVENLTPAPIDYPNLIKQINNLKPIRGVQL